MDSERTNRGTATIFIKGKIKNSATAPQPRIEAHEQNYKNITESKKKNVKNKTKNLRLRILPQGFDKKTINKNDA